MLLLLFRSFSSNAYPVDDLLSKNTEEQRTYSLSSVFASVRACSTSQQMPINEWTAHFDSLASWDDIDICNMVSHSLGNPVILAIIEVLLLFPHYYYYCHYNFGQSFRMMRLLLLLVGVYLLCWRWQKQEQNSHEKSITVEQFIVIMRACVHSLYSLKWFWVKMWNFNAFFFSQLPCPWI